MKLKHLFYFQSVFALLSALGFLFVPAMMWSSFGTPSESALMDLVGQNTGSLLLFSGLIAFFAARHEKSSLRRDICLTYFVLHTVSFIVYAPPLLKGGPSFGPSWIFNLILAIAFGYFRFVRQTRQAQGETSYCRIVL